MNESYDLLFLNLRAVTTCILLLEYMYILALPLIPPWESHMLCASVSTWVKYDFNHVLKLHHIVPLMLYLLWAGHAMSKLGYAATPSIAVTEQHIGIWQLAFGSFFVFSLMLLPGLWHRHDCLVEKQLAVNMLFFTQLWIFAMGIRVSKLCFNTKAP